MAEDPSAPQQDPPGTTGDMDLRPRMISYLDEHDAEPDEIVPSYVFFASDRLSGYYSGEVLAPIGGETLPG